MATAEAGVFGRVELVYGANKMFYWKPQGVGLALMASISKMRTVSKRVGEIVCCVRGITAFKNAFKYSNSFPRYHYMVDLLDHYVSHYILFFQ